MEQRIEFALKALRTLNFRELCREYGISTKTGYQWRERLLEHGLAGLNELSRRPHAQPQGLTEAVVCAMVRLKQAHPHWGPRKIQALYARQHVNAAVPSESSFKRVLIHHRIGHKHRRLDHEHPGTNAVWGHTAYIVKQPRSSTGQDLGGVVVGEVRPAGTKVEPIAILHAGATAGFEVGRPKELVTPN